MARVTVVFPIYFDTDNIVGLKIDKRRIAKGDEDYVEEVREKLKALAKVYFDDQGSDSPIITNSDIDELIE